MQARFYIELDTSIDEQILGDDLDKSNIDLIGLLNTLPISDWGIADIRGLHPMAERFPTAITMLFAYDLEFEDHCEKAYESLLVDTRTRAKQAMCEVRGALERMGAAYYTVGMVPQNEETLTGDFPLKTAATRAGLGWIGKSGLLVTERFGPRVRPEAILVDLDLPYSRPIKESRCGDCRDCVDNCPIKCLKDTHWQAGMERDKIIDAFACAEFRKSYIPILGRRCACGWCALTCPMGR